MAKNLSDELSGFPSKREHLFKIKLILGTQHIFGPPYRMAVVEQTELKKQIDDLLSKGFIRPIVPPWVAPMIFVEKKE